MAVPANSTRTTVAHRRTDIVDPHDLPKQYVLPAAFLSPAVTSGDDQVFTTDGPIMKDDIVAVWRKPETLGPEEPHVSLFRIDFGLPEDWRVTDPSRVRTHADMIIVFKTVAEDKAYLFRASEIEAIHKWVGIRPKGESLPVAAAQNELSLFTPTGNEPLTMSSREIAELTEKQHAHVLRDIRVLLDAVIPGWEKDDPVLEHQGISITYDNRGYVSEIHLPKDLTITLVAGYDANLRLKIVRRWMELEGAAKKPSAPEFPIPQTFAEALMLAANQAAQIEHQKGAIAEKNAQIADMRQDVDALDRIAGADDLFGVRVAAKILQMPERKFVEAIQRIGWAYRQAGTKHLLGYSDKQKAGYVASKVTTYTKSDGSEGVKDTLKFTTLGIVRLAKALKVAVTEHDIRTLLGREKGAAA